MEIATCLLNSVHLWEYLKRKRSQGANLSVEWEVKEPGLERLFKYGGNRV